MVLYFHTVANAFYCEIKFISPLLPIFVYQCSHINGRGISTLQADIAITNTAVANKSLFILYIFKSESMYFRYGRCDINAGLIFGDRV